MYLPEVMWSLEVGIPKFWGLSKVRSWHHSPPLVELQISYTSRSKWWFSEARFLFAKIIQFWPDMKIFYIEVMGQLQRKFPLIEEITIVYSLETNTSHLHHLASSFFGFLRRGGDFPKVPQSSQNGILRVFPSYPPGPRLPYFGIIKADKTSTNLSHCRVP